MFEEEVVPHCKSNGEPWRAMAQEQKVTMTCVVLGKPDALRLCGFAMHGSLQAPSRHRPIAIDPEGVTVRCFTVNNRG